MKKILAYLLPLLMLAASCSRDKATYYTISGKAADEQCHLLLFGLDGRYEKADSIKSDNDGDFKYTIPVDTLTPLALLMPDGRMVTLYAEPNIKAKISRDETVPGKWVVKGGKSQALHDSISIILDKCSSYIKLSEHLDEFVKSNPISPINTELIRRYVIDVPNPENSKINDRISKLGGILQDQEFFVTTSKQTDRKRTNTPHKLFPSFKYELEDKSKLELSSYMKKYLLVTFWASWDERSRNEMPKLRAVKDSVESESFSILNIALEHDTANWKKFITTDSIVGDNVCDTKAWNSELANKLNIKSLPFSILVTPYQRIIRFDLKLDEAGSLIDSLATKYDISENKKKDDDVKKKKEEEERRKKAQQKEKEKQKKDKKNKDFFEIKENTPILQK